MRLRKKRQGAIVTAAFVLASSQAVVEAAGPTSMRVLGGLAVPTQGLQEDTDTHLGPNLRGDVAYALTREIRLSLDVGWNRHNVERSNVELGDVSTLSVLTGAQVRFLKTRLSPYFTTGIGVNINSFDESSRFGIACPSCDLDPDTTLALRIGVGSDYRWTDRLSLSFEGAWRYDSGDADLTLSSGESSSVDFNASVFELGAGVRFHLW